MRNLGIHNFNGESEEENAGQHIFGNIDPNVDLQSQQHAMQEPLLSNRSFQDGSSSGGNRLPQNQRNQHGSDAEHLEEIVCEPKLDKATKKKMADKKSRDKKKKQKSDMLSELDVLQNENQKLNSQYAFLTEENNKSDQALQYCEEEIKKRKNYIRQLKSQKDKQSVLIKTLLDKVVDPEYVIASSQNANMEILKLTLENEKLKHKNKRRKVKVHALCEKLISDSNKIIEQDHSDEGWGI